MSELTVEADGLRITIAAAGAGAEALWAFAGAAFLAVQRARTGQQNDCWGLCNKPNNNHSAPATSRPKQRSGKASKAARVRDVARQILSDGKVHERRELAKAVREAGLDPQIIGRALDGTFEKGENVMGRPTYRDRTVPSGYVSEPVPDEQKPTWMRDREPASGGGFALTGKLTENGIVETNGGGDG